MKRAALSALLASQFVVSGCSDVQLSAVNSAVQSARGGSVARVVTSAAIAQMAVVHVAAALSDAARREFNGADVPTLASAAGSEYMYSVDAKAGRGTVTRETNGKRTVDLGFSFVTEPSNAGKAYAITGTTGTFEGYQMVFPRLTVSFTAVLGERLTPARHENGSQLMNVEIRAVGTLGANGNEVAQVSDLAFSLTYPALPGERKVGSLKVVGRDGTTMNGAVLEQEGALKISGGVTSPSGSPVYRVDTGANGELSLSEEPGASSTAEARPPGTADPALPTRAARLSFHKSSGLTP